MCLVMGCPMNALRRVAHFQYKLRIDAVIGMCNRTEVRQRTARLGCAVKRVGWCVAIRVSSLYNALDGIVIARFGGADSKPMHNETTGIAKYVRIDAMRDRIKEIDETVEPLIRERQQLEKFVAVYDETTCRERAYDQAEATAPSILPAVGEPESMGKKLGGSELAAKGRDVLLELGRDLTTAELLDELHARFIVASGQSEQNTLYAALHRAARLDEGIELVGRGTWRAVDFGGAQDHGQHRLEDAEDKGGDADEDDAQTK